MNLGASCTTQILFFLRLDFCAALSVLWYINIHIAIVISDCITLIAKLGKTIF